MMLNQVRDRKTKIWALAMGAIAVGFYIGFFVLMHFRG